MIEYSEKAMQGYAHLYQPYNDIDVFVEDSTCHNMYKILINRILQGKGRVERVFGLGNKRAVEEACAKDSEIGRRPRLYIVDGDMDIIRGKRRRRRNGLYRLKVYCIENLLIDKQAMCEVLQETLVEAGVQEIERRLGFEIFVESMERVILPLWILYAIVFEARVAIETVSYSVHRFREQGKGVEGASPRMVRGRMREIVRELWAEIGRERYLKKKRDVRRRVQSRSIRAASAVSGKDYIFPLLYERAKHCGGYHDSERSLKVRLARHCDVRREGGLYREVHREIRRFR